MITTLLETEFPKLRDSLVVLSRPELGVLYWMNMIIKVGRNYPMVISSELCMGQYRDDDRTPLYYKNHFKFAIIKDISSKALICALSNQEAYPV